MKQTKKEIELVEKLTKLNLHQNQIDGIIKLYRKHKDEQISIDQGHRFKDINEGNKVRDFIFINTIPRGVERGVYKISFDGAKFYIGRSKQISLRIKQHKNELLNYFKGERNNSSEHYFRRVFDYLANTPMAYYIEIQIIEECISLEELQTKEQKWLNKYKSSPNCLNVGFIAKRPPKEIEETIEEQQERIKNIGIARRGGRLIFYPKKKIEADVLRKNTASTPFKKDMANSFSFNVPELTSDLGHTVFKLFYGDRYIIHKGKTLSGSLFLLQKGCGYFLAYDHAQEQTFDKDYYNSFYDYIRLNPGNDFRVEVIFTSEDAYEILCREQVELDNAIKDKKCLNQNIKGYIPKLNPKTNMHGWITIEQVNKFYEFLEVA